jgi:hypothetical protein
VFEIQGLSIMVPFDPMLFIAMVYTSPVHIRPAQRNCTLLRQQRWCELAVATFYLPAYMYWSSISSIKMLYSQWVFFAARHNSHHARVSGGEDYSEKLTL